MVLLVKVEVEKKKPDHINKFFKSHETTPQNVDQWIVENQKLTHKL